MFRLFLSFCLCHVVTAMHPASANAEDSQVSDHEQDAWSRRHRLDDVFVSVAVRQYDHTQGEPDLVFQQRDDIWISGSDWRVDNHPGGSGGEFFYREFFSNGRNGFYGNEQGCIELNTVESGDSPPSSDPRRIGFGIGTTVQLTSLPMLVVAQSRSTPREISTVTLDGTEYTRVAYSRRKARYEMYFSARIPFPERIEMRYGTQQDAEHFVSVASYDNPEWLQVGMPSRVDHTIHRGGQLAETIEEVVREVRVEIPKADMQSVFSMKGLGVPAGSSVVDMSTGSASHFDGASVVAGATPSALIQTARAGRSRITWLLAANSVAFPAAAILIWLRAHWRRGRQ